MSGTDDDIDGTSEQTAFLAAIKKGDAAEVRLLLEKDEWKTKIDEENENGETPLHVAAQTGADAIVLRLLEAGADPNQADSGGHTALSIARRMGYSSIVALLEEHQK